MLAQHSHFRLFGKSFLKAVSQPVGHRIAHHKHGGCHGPGILLARRRRRSGKVGRRFAPALPLPILRPALWLAEPATKWTRFLAWLLALRVAPRAPKLCVRGYQQSEAQ